jgi:hypothetical protein
MPLIMGRVLKPGVWISLLFAGCEPGTRAPATDRPSPPDHVADRPADTLVLTTAAGVEIWYGLARSGRGPDGAPCVERGLEIRRGQRRIQVPLLYTGETPTLLNDSTMRAVLWTNCRPGDAYLVDLTNGRPVRQPEGPQ